MYSGTVDTHHESCRLEPYVLTLGTLLTALHNDVPRSLQFTSHFLQSSGRYPRRRMFGISFTHGLQQQASFLHITVIHTERHTDRETDREMDNQSNTHCHTGQTPTTSQEFSQYNSQVHWTRQNRAQPETPQTTVNVQSTVTERSHAAAIDTSWDRGRVKGHPLWYLWFKPTYWLTNCADLHSSTTTSVYEDEATGMMRRRRWFEDLREMNGRIKEQEKRKWTRTDRQTYSRRTTFSRAVTTSPLNQTEHSTNNSQVTTVARRSEANNYHTLMIHRTYLMSPPWVGIMDCRSVR